jgi:hypothetical protein
MASLLSKFRIDYHSLKMVSGITDKPQDQTVKFFSSLLEDFCEEDNVDPGETNTTSLKMTSRNIPYISM